MASYGQEAIGPQMLGGWQTEIAEVIAVDTGTKKLNDAKINLLNKRYEEAKGYKLTGTAIDAYVSKNSGTAIMANTDKVSPAVAKAFRENIEETQKREKERLKNKADEKARKKWPWYYYAILGGGMLTFIALSPTLNTFAKMIPRKGE